MAKPYTIVDRIEASMQLPGPATVSPVNALVYVNAKYSAADGWVPLPVASVSMWRQVETAPMSWLRGTTRRMC